MFYKGFVFALVLNVAFSAPQFIGFKDGKIGVNFGGYHAEAGLGGLLTGNAAHGGLSASAGTPFGQEAAAGLGGGAGGRAGGGAFAAATAGGDVGASAGLAGGAGVETSGGLGAEAHAGGASHSVVGNSGSGFQITKQIAVPVQGEINYSASGSAGIGAQGESSVIQKIRPPKKYVPEVAQSNPVAVVEKRKFFAAAPPPPPPPPPAQFPIIEAGSAKSGSFAAAASGSVNGGTFFDSIFNIPIATLKAVNGLLNTGLQGSGSLAFGKAVNVHG